MTADLNRMTHVTGFGLVTGADSYLYRPTSEDEVADILELARRSGRQITLRGAGRSYGDANIGSETILLDISRMNQILHFDSAQGTIDCQAGVTLEQIWRHVIEDGYWPPVVSGTMFPTLAGALGMNLHGKNAFQAGPIGNFVLEYDVVFPNGTRRTLNQNSPLFSKIISSAGLLGVITRVKLKLKKIQSGDLRVLPISVPNWQAQFAAFEEFNGQADYMVSWIDCFAKGEKAGRGLFHTAWYLDDASDAPLSLRPEHQDLPDTILGRFPKSTVWRYLKKLNNRPGMKFTNWGKYLSAKLLGNGKPHPQSLVGFSFLLDYVPGWRKAYLPGGFIQIQTFVPKEHAPRVFAEQLRLQQEAKLESFLGVMKRHIPDQFLFSHGVDGYSLALDFKVTKSNKERVWQLAHAINDLVLTAGGKFYLAKDSTLRPEDFKQSLGDEAFAEYARLKLELDPDAILTSDLAKRLLLDPRSVG
ncbi:MAG: FAD-binding oxidoreductase [Fimbriimonadaceae bacterium]|nr:FAD-binding oxidoreductase [Fimbriimonadaceae bacterium]